MLVLSRRTEEKIILPTVPAVIKVVSTQPGQVRLGFEAPAGVAILREELVGGDTSLQALARAAGRPTEAHPALRTRLDHLTLALALLRLRLENAGEDVRAALHRIDQEVQSLQALAGPVGGGPPPRSDPKGSPSRQDACPVQ